MTTTSLTRLAATAVATGVASLALAAPATALEVEGPGGPANGGYTPTATTTDDATPWLEIGLGALGGLAVAGAGVAAATSMRHRQTLAATS